MKTSLLKILAFGCLSITTLAVPIAYNKSQSKKLTLRDAFKDMTSKVSNVFAPKVKPVKIVRVSASYDVRQHSIITGSRLNDVLGGVLKGRGQKFLDEARANNLCPIFFAAICMHESANGSSKFSREKNNVFGIFKSGKYHNFKSVDECIEFAAHLLGRGRCYAGGGNYTVLGIQRVYCPVGADNDPKNLNRFWLGGVLDKMKKIWGEEVFVLI